MPIRSVRNLLKFRVLVMTLFGGALRGYAADSCDKSGTPRDMAACLSAQFADEKKQLDSVYQFALDKLADSDPTDRRKSRAQLVNAETAWAAYVEANCAYIGGIEGGSNSWISVFEASCLGDAYRDRINFFLDSPSQVK